MSDFRYQLLTDAAPYPIITPAELRDGAPRYRLPSTDAYSMRLSSLMHRAADALEAAHQQIAELEKELHAERSRRRWYRL